MSLSEYGAKFEFWILYEYFHMFGCNYHKNIYQLNEDLKNMITQVFNQYISRNIWQFW